MRAFSSPLAIGNGHEDTPEACSTWLAYISAIHIYSAAMANADIQKGSAEMIVLALLEGRARHGYELAKLIETQSESRLQFHVASLYPMLYRMERKKLVEGKWVEKAGERR